MLRRTASKNPTTTKNYYGTVITPIIMYTTIQLKQNNLSSCRFANTTLLQLWRIIITKMRRHWKRQALKKVVSDATTTCPAAASSPTTAFSLFLIFFSPVLHPPPHAISSLTFLSLSPHLFLLSVQALCRGTGQRQQVAAMAVAPAPPHHNAVLDRGGRWP